MQTLEVITIQTVYLEFLSGLCRNFSTVRCLDSVRNLCPYSVKTFRLSGVCLKRQGLDRATRITIPLPAELCMEWVSLIFLMTSVNFTVWNDMKIHIIYSSKDFENVLNPHMEHPILWIPYFFKEGNIWKKFIWSREMYIFNLVNN